MATRALTFDDIDNSPDASLLRWSVEDTHYELDVAEHNRKAFEEAVAPFIAVARVVEPRRAQRKPQGVSAGTPTYADMRKWAAENGLPVSPKGRIAAEVVQAYIEAH